MRFNIITTVTYACFYTVAMTTLESEGISIGNYKWWLVIISMTGLAIYSSIRERGRL